MKNELTLSPRWKALCFALVLAFIALQAHAKDGRNLLVKENASTGKRVALVIGNGNYKYSDSLPKLANPAHDAEDIARALRGFGFEVIEKKDQNLEDMSDTIAEFGRKIANSEAALFYFAGHGLQVKGQNYLIPVNAKIESEAQVPFQSINVNQLLEEMDNGKSRANIVMLDACRNNPISGKFRSGATRGLAAPSSQPMGTVIVYATDPGNVAADGNGRNGLFTAGLLTAFKGSDLSLHGVLVRASKEVERGSGQKQTPYINGPATLQDEFRFAPGTPGQATQIASLVPVSAPSPAAPNIPVTDDAEGILWQAAESGGVEEDVRTYLRQYPNGRYVALAKPLIQRFADDAAQAKGQKEQEAWQAAGKANTEAGYQEFLKAYPSGRFVALALGRLEPLLWQKAEADEKGQIVQAYLDKYPSGSHVSAAQEKLAAIRKAEADLEAQKGYVSQGGLTWMPIKNEGKTWLEANNYCANTTLIGQTGWRLPTKDELNALYASGAMKGQGWAFGYAWSSTPTGYYSDHYLVSLRDDFGSYRVIGSDGGAASATVTCVR